TEGAYITTLPGSTAAYVTKFNAAGSAPEYATFLGGADGAFVGTHAASIAVDAAGNATITGLTDDTDFPVTNDAFQQTDKSAGCEVPQAFLTRFNPNGSDLVYSSYLGGDSLQFGFCIGAGYFGNGVAVDPSGNAYLAGNATWGRFPVTTYALSRS